MTIIVTTSETITDRATQGTSLIVEIRDFWKQFIAAAFNPYRPEQHYMRGPGPACMAKRNQRDH